MFAHLKLGLDRPEFRFLNASSTLPDTIASAASSIGSSSEIKRNALDRDISDCSQITETPEDMSQYQRGLYVIWRQQLPSPEVIHRLGQ